MRRPFLVLLLIEYVAFTATAQAEPAPAPPAMYNPHRTVSDWPSRADMPDWREFRIVTLAHPGVRQPCKVVDLRPEFLSCKNAHHHPPTIYRRDDIATILDPPDHGHRNEVLITLGITAAMLAGSFFVPLGWAIALRVCTGIGLYGLAWDIGMGPSDHGNDILIYQHPNTPLTIKLRT